MRGIQFAWQVHAVQEQWSARADTKATVVFTIEAAVIAAVVAAFGNPAVAASVTGWRAALVWLGLLASATAVVIAAAVVIPQLGRRAEHTGQMHLIYFGHLHSWQPDDLAARLSTMSDDDEIGQLAAQLTRLGAVNWRKFRLLRVAMVAALIGATLLAVAFAWPR